MNQVEQRIKEALTNNSKELDLSNLGLTSLPNSFLEIAPTLETLNLHSNGFINLPRVLGSCRNLKRLHLGNNQLTDLFGIRSLQKLETLIVSNNELTYFPTDLLEVKSLTILWMDGNKMTSIPQGILELKKLRFLGLENNLIEILPAEIAQLPELDTIVLDNNPLKTPPIEIALRGIHSIRGYFEDLSKTEKEKTENYLLSIAIDEYADLSFSPQKGRVEDAQNLSNVLQEKYEYQAFHLFNQEATANKILSQLDELVEKTKESDSVIIYFNSQISDAYGYGYFSFDMEKIEEQQLYSAISRMRAQHVLIIIDFHYYTSQGTTTRGISLEKGTYSSRWIMHRQGAEWEDRFTPQLVEFLSRLNFEVGVQELLSVLKDVVIAPLNLGGDEGGMFNFIPKKDWLSNEIVGTFLQDDLIGLKKELKELIAKARTKELFNKLLSIISKDSRFRKDVVELREKFVKNNLDFGLGRIDSETDMRNFTITNKTLLLIIDELKISDITNNISETKTPADREKNQEGFGLNLENQKRYYKEEYIAKAKSRELFNVILDDLSSDSTHHQDISLLAQRFEKILSDKYKGLTTEEENNIAINRVNYSLLNIIDDLTIGDFKSEKIEKSNTSTIDYSEEEKDTLEKINEKIIYVEELRKAYFEINSIKGKRDILKSIDESLAELESLRKSIGANLEQNFDEDESFKFLEEEKLWQNAISNNTKEAFQKYLDETTVGTYRQEASVAIHDLELENEEDELFKKIKSREKISHINIYRSEFPEGKYIQDVNAIFQKIENEEEELWERLSKKNTIEAYDEYLEKSKLKTHERSAVKRKRRMDKEGLATRINEAKLIFVGNGRVGKTSLTKRLVNNEFDPKEESTHGIRIEKWPLKLEDGRTVNVNVWDFGGQEIYHNTHRFFLTNRALYILVWDSKSQIDAEDHPEKEENFIFDYWLENVSGLSEESPVLVVQNKIEEPSLRGFDVSNLTENKSWNVKETLAVSAAEGWKIEELRDTIAKQLQNAPKLKNLIGYDLGEGWSAVRRELETSALEQPYLKFDDYLKICTTQEISAENAEDLSRFLTDIGVIIHFPDNAILKEMVILDPRWTTKIIYRLLNEKIKENQGQFKKADLTVNMKKEELERFSKDFRFRDEREIQIFLELMSKFEICFELPNEDDSFIVPQFLQEEKPAFDWECKKANVYGYKYDFLHKGIIARAIVKLNEYAYQNTWWRNGIVIEKEGIKAKVESMPKQNEIKIELIGAEGEQLRKFLLNDIFEEVNQKLEVKTIRYCPSETCDCTFEEEIILKLEKQNQKYITCTGCNCNVRIDEILGKDIEDMDQPKIFISYSHKDEKHKDELQSWLKSLQYSFEIDVWEDRQIKVGDDWSEEISNALDAAEFIILLISKDFLASDFIHDVEVKRAFERDAKGEAVVIPVIVRPCFWQQDPIQQVQVVPVDGKPVTKFEDQDEAWLQVLEKIKDRIEK